MMEGSDRHWEWLGHEYSGWIGTDKKAPRLALAGLDPQEPSTSDFLANYIQTTTSSYLATGMF